MAVAVVASATPAKPAKPLSVKRVPQRTCVACRTTGGKKGLLRVVRQANGAGVVLDPTGKVSGRGAYVCLTPECIGLAIKQKKLERSLKAALPEETANALKAASLDAAVKTETATAAEEQAKQAEQAV